MWRPENPPQQTGASLKIPAGQREINIANRDYGPPRACVLLTVHCLYKTIRHHSYCVFPLKKQGILVMVTAGLILIPIPHFKLAKHI